MKNRKKFKSKIIKSFFLISILPLLIISSTSLYIVFDSGKKNIIELENLAIDNASEKVQKFLNEKMDVFNLVLSGNANDLKEIEINYLSYLNDLVNNLSTMAGDVVEISYINSVGMEVVKIPFVGAPKLNNVKDREDFRTAFSGQNYFGEVIYENNMPLIRLASQIESDDREIIGVISDLVNLKSLNKAVENIKLGKSGYVYLVDENGKYITGSRDEYLPPDKDLSGIKEIKSIIDGENKENSVKIYNNPLQEKVVLSGKNISGYKWFVISEWPKSDAYKTIYNILSQSLAIIAITMAFVVIFGLFAARQIIGPIKTLNNGVGKIAEGDLDYKIKLETGDEFEVLAGEFNKMTDVLKENRQLRDEFVFIAAHELRTPVTAIRGYLSMVLDENFGKIKDEVKKALTTVEKANDRLVQLVQDLLEVARSEAGKMKIESRPVNIKENINEIIKELKSLSDEKGMKINYKGLDKEVMVGADSAKLNEVLTNIIGNAVKYTVGGGDVDVYHEIDKDKNALITRVKDHGLGMKKEDMDKLFSKFYRIQTNETSKIEGTGLGLFICKEIVERMGGKIWAESEEGKGSTFSFSLKLV